MLHKQVCTGLRRTVFIIDEFNNMKTGTEGHHLQNSSPGTANSESILLKKVLKVAG